MTGSLRVRVAPEADGSPSMMKSTRIHSWPGLRGAEAHFADRENGCGPLSLAGSGG
jgi:hypothetical protein